MKRAAILARGYFGARGAKTAHGLIRHGKIYKIVEVVDETLAGKDAGVVMGDGYLGIPIVEDFSKAIDVLIIGVAPAGGKLPERWRSDIKRAIQGGIDIVSGLHDFLAEDPEFAKLAKENKVNIWDVRKPPNKKELDIARGWVHQAPVVLVCGTDSCVGKRTTALELKRAAERAGLNAGFVATGQTGILVGCDAGIVVDALPSDFVSGAVEKMAQKASKDKELIFIEGQGSLFHSAYGGVALGILHGAKPDMAIIAHDPARRGRNSYPEEIPKLEEEIELIEKLGKTSVVGISLNCQSVKNRSGVIEEYERKYRLPAADVLRSKDGAEKLLRAILKKLNISK